MNLDDSRSIRVMDKPFRPSHKFAHDDSIVAHTEIGAAVSAENHSRCQKRCQFEPARSGPDNPLVASLILRKIRSSGHASAAGPNCRFAQVFLYRGLDDEISQLLHRASVDRMLRTKSKSRFMQGTDRRSVLRGRIGSLQCESRPTESR